MDNNIGKILMHNTNPWEVGCAMKVLNREERIALHMERIREYISDAANLQKLEAKLYQEYTCNKYLVLQRGDGIEYIVRERDISNYAVIEKMPPTYMDIGRPA